MTVYYQFHSRLRLLEALYDHLAARGQMFRLAEAFHEPDPRSAKIYRRVHRLLVFRPAAHAQASGLGGS
jgi:AcrR family transcriptional regulator